METKSIICKELPVDKRTAFGIFDLVKQNIQISQEIEDQIIDEIDRMDKSLKEFEDPLD